MIKVIGLEYDQVKLVDHCEEWLSIFENEKAKTKIILAKKYRNNRNLYRLFQSQFIENIIKLKK